MSKLFARYNSVLTTKRKWTSLDRERKCEELEFGEVQRKVVPIEKNTYLSTCCSRRITDNHERKIIIDTYIFLLDYKNNRTYLVFLKQKSKRVWVNELKLSLLLLRSTSFLYVLYLAFYSLLDMMIYIRMPTLFKAFQNERAMRRKGVMNVCMLYNCYKLSSIHTNNVQNKLTTYLKSSNVQTRYKKNRLEIFWLVFINISVERRKWAGMGNDRDDDDDDGIFSCDFRSLSSLEPPHHLCKQTHVVFLSQTH